MADTLNVVDVSAHEELKYMHASNVNVFNFVSVSIEDDYYIWKEQMYCLMESRKMRGIVEDSFIGPGATSVEIIKQYDCLLRGWILGSLPKDALKKVVVFKSARDVWMNLKLIYDPKPSFKIDLVSNEFTIATEVYSIPEIDNDDIIKRNRILYKATVEGSWWKAKAILKNHRDAATKPISEDGNTMLHLAVGLGQNYFLANLLNFIENGVDIEKKNKDEQTALHIAAITDNKYAAQLLVKKRNELLVTVDNNSHTPLISAYNHMRLNTYVYLLKAEDKTPPTISLRNAEKLLITSIFTKQYELTLAFLNIYPEFASKSDQILMAIAKTFPTDLGFWETFFYPSLNNFTQKILERGSLLFKSSDVLYKGSDYILRAMGSYKYTSYSWVKEVVMILLVPIAIVYPIYELIRLLILVLRFPFFMLYFLMWKVLAFTVRSIKNIEKKKKDYIEAKKLLCFICDQIDKENYFTGAHHPFYIGPILEAVRQDAYEVVDEILFRSPSTINCKNEEWHNVIQLAIINRSYKVYNLIYHIIERKESYRTMTDSLKNNLVHLAGRLAPAFVLARTTGAALQLQRELQWCEEVEKFMLPTDLTHMNVQKETPAMVFRREHEDLLKKGETWMKTTAESCSITAALIVTIVFAAAITVPGGSNQNSGIPLFKKEIAFSIFAVSDAISLFSAATALLLFLSILTARFAERDFLISIPRRLIFGVFALFLSTAAMMVAFGTILFLVFCDQRPWMLIPIALSVCLPIGAIVTLQSPLVVDLFMSTYFPIFGKQSYIDCCKTKPSMSFKHPTSLSRW